jgi:hypothetical protein
MLQILDAVLSRHFMQYNTKLVFSDYMNPETGAASSSKMSEIICHSTRHIPGDFSLH